MNAGFCICVLLAVLFLILGLVFVLLKEKAALLVSGFNTLPKYEQNRYDKARLSRDMSRQFFLWAGILAIGALLSAWLSPYFAIPAAGAWLMLLFKNVSLDEKKAFEKYRIEE